MCAISSFLVKHFFVGMKFNLDLEMGWIVKGFSCKFYNESHCKIILLCEFYIKWTEIIKFARDCFCKVVKLTSAIFTMNLFCKLVEAYPRPSLVRTLSGGVLVNYGCPSYLHFHLPQDFFRELVNFSFLKMRNYFKGFPCENLSMWILCKLNPHRFQSGLLYIVTVDTDLI